MQKSDKVLRVLAIPYSALASVIFGMMIVSFPIGAYLVFNSDIGKDITFEYPLQSLDIFLGGIGVKLPIQFELGDGFVVIWCAYLILFAICLCGPKRNFMRALTTLMTEGWQTIKSNALLGMITWFSILIVFSVVIDTVQQSVGITTKSPEFQNDLLKFFGVTASPLTEELGFRMLLIGLPLYAMFSHHASFRHFFSSLWNPSANLDITNYKKAIALIVAVGIFFGVAHILSGTPWSAGKISQASVAGIIIGWVYVRYGLAPAILIHWGTNYVTFSYIALLSSLNQTSVEKEITSPLLNNLEFLLLAAGLIAMVGLVLNYVKSKKEPTALAQA